MINESEQTRKAYKAAQNKAQSMNNTFLLAVWEALGMKAAWIDNRYDEYLSLEDWAEIVYGELSKRHLIKEAK